MENVQEIVEGIDEGMDGNVIYMPRDIVRQLSHEVWDELWDSHERFGRTFEDIAGEYVKWLNTHRVIGAIAIEGVTDGNAQ